MSDRSDLLHDALEGDTVSADAEIRGLVLTARRVRDALLAEPLAAEDRARILARATSLARRRRVVGDVRRLLPPRRPALLGAAGVTLAAVSIALLRARRHRAPAVA